MGKIYLKSCKTSELKLCMSERLRSFQRSAVGLFRSTGSKVTSCQSWRVDKKFCCRAQVKAHASSPGSNPVLLWKDLNLLNIQIFNSEDQQDFQYRFFPHQSDPIYYIKQALFILNRAALYFTLNSNDLLYFYLQVQLHTVSKNEYHTPGDKQY